MTTLANRIPSQVELRAELERLVVGDLLGPVGGPEEEIAEGRPQDRYLLGCLAPNRTVVDPSRHDGLGAEEGVGTEDGEGDTENPQARSIFPQAIGMTFCVGPAVEALTVTARWGRYERTATRR